MNGKFLLDTNAILGLLKGQLSVVAFLESAGVDTLFASVITRMELLSFPGITPEEETRVRDFLDTLSIVPLGDAVEATAIRLRSATRRKLPDAVVAASAIVSDATLVTYDRELAGTAFPGLIIVNPETSS